MVQKKVCRSKLPKTPPFGGLRGLPPKNCPPVLTPVCGHFVWEAVIYIYMGRSTLNCPPTAQVRTLYFSGPPTVTWQKVVFFATLSGKLFFAQFTFVAAKNSTRPAKSSENHKKWPQKSRVFTKKHAFSMKNQWCAQNAHGIQRAGIFEKTGFFKYARFTFWGPRQ